VTADPRLAARSPLHTYAERFRTAGRDDTVRLRELPFLPMTEYRGDSPPAPVDGGHLLRLGPDWWLLVGAAPSGPDGVDVSAQRTTLELRGPRSRDVLMTGCALDLHPRAFRVGAGAHTLVAQAQVVLHRTTAETYRLLVRASFAGYLADWLLDAMVEHGDGG
jgi:sarcosine oxidase, subunit alpha